MSARTSAVVLVAIVAISTVGDYSIKAVGSMNWDIALMITPYGIVRFWLMPGHYLQPYFQQQPPLPSIVDQPMVALCIVLIFCFAFLSLEKIRAGRSKRK